MSALRYPILGLAMVLLFAPALACEGKEVKITVVQILASEESDKIDPELECIARAIQKDHPKLKGFKLHHICCKYIPIGGKADFALVGKQQVSVEVEHDLDKKQQIGLRVKPPRAGEIAYTVCCGKFFPFLTRYLTDDRERLILAIKVQDCKK